MDFFTSTYNQIQRDLKSQRMAEIEQARAEAVFFFSEMFPDFFDRLKAEGYEIEGGMVSDWSDEGFPDTTCEEILILKNGKSASLSLMKTWYVYADKSYGIDSYRQYLSDTDHEDMDPIRDRLSAQAIKGISEAMIKFIGSNFCASEPVTPYLISTISPQGIGGIYNVDIEEDAPSRDELAALAMGGIMAGYGYRQLTTQDIHSVSHDAYAIADAMLAARENGHESKLS